MNTEGSKRWSDYVWEATRKSRTLLFSSAVTSTSVRDMTDRLLALEADSPDAPITIILNSPGGSVLDGYSLVDMIRFVRPQIRMVGAGLIASMGISLLLAVDKQYRYSLPNARFMLHQPRFGGKVLGSISDLEIEATEMVKMKDKSNEEIAKATGQSVEKIANDTRRDLWLSADEALDYGLVCKIIESTTEIE
ncbi:MAG: ATP-dependent Clp protease protease subunit [Myxococcota bacterium]|jgi:ATP-dependent Clp protease protease subunit